MWMVIYTLKMLIKLVIDKQELSNTTFADVISLVERNTVNLAVAA